MPFSYFAGAIFTTQEVVIFCLVAFAITGTLAGSIIFVGKKLLDIKRGGSAKSKLSPGMALLIGFGLITSVILLFFVMPTVIKDSNRATAESQSAYRECLDL